MMGREESWYQTFLSMALEQDGLWHQKRTRSIPQDETGERGTGQTKKS